MTIEDSTPYPFPDTAAAVTPPAPRDHLPKQSGSAQIQADVRSEPPVGHNLLKPVTDLRSGQIAEVQADIMDLFNEIGLDISKDGEQDIEATPEVLRAFGKLGTLLEGFAVDKAGFIALDTGKGAQNRVMELAMWYIAELGESEGSATS